MNKGLFITLDETLITTKSGKSFPINSTDWKFKTDFYNLFKNAFLHNYKIVIIDNQLGIGKGFITEKAFIKKLEAISNIIENDINLPTNSILFTYCSEEEDAFRLKPNPGMLYEIAIDNDIILNESIL